MGNGTSNSGQPSALISLKEWNHIVVVYNKTAERLSVFKNGVLSSSTTTATNQMVIEDARDVTIGKTSGFYNGSLDEFRIHNRPLGFDEIKRSHFDNTKLISHNFTNLTFDTYNYTACAVSNNASMVCDYRNLGGYCNTSYLTGDWVIGNEVICKDEAFNITGDLTIQAAGDFMIETSNLSLDFVTNRFLIQDGGKVYIKANSKLG